MMKNEKSPKKKKNFHQKIYFIILPGYISLDLFFLSTHVTGRSKSGVTHYLTSGTNVQPSQKKKAIDPQTKKSFCTVQG